MRAVNLIPADQRGGASVGAGRSQGGAYAVLALACGLALLALLYGSAHHEVGSRRAEAASVTAEAARAHTAAEQLAPYTSFIALREQRAQAVTTLVDSRFDWAHVFHEFGRVLPAQTSISSLSGTIGSGTSSVSGSSSSSSSSSSTSSSSTSSSTPAAASASVSSATPPGSVPSFTLTGCATSQPVVAQTLQRLRLMDGVSSVALQSSVISSSSGSGGGVGCPPKGPAFTVQITFDPLPTAAAETSATKTVSDSGTSAK
jgi:hypothetical protein